MNIKKVSPRFFVSEQISLNDTGLAAAQGIKIIICNRLENETADQPRTEDIADAASGVGIEFLHIPVSVGKITEANITEFAAAYKNAQGPILAYCRSGLRSTSLWALVEAASMDINSILAAAKDAGYDLTALRSRLELQAAKEIAGSYSD